MLNALIYCRVSTEEQAAKGFSLDVQEKLCRDFASRNDYDPVSVYRDEGKSGTSLDRPALKDLLGRCQEDKSINAVVVQETDRLARNTKDHLTIRAILQKAGVKLISVAQPMLDDSPEGNMIDTILASVNQFQSDINSRKTRKSLQEKFNQGWLPSWAPLGYLNTSIGTSEEGQRVRKIITKDPERWELLKEGFRFYLSGNYSVLELITIMDEKGLRSFGGKRMPHSVMTNILQNPFYTGLMRWNGQEKMGKHEPMITLSEHEQILQILASHNQYACRKRKHSFLLRGFVICNICGQRYTAERHPRKRKSYYHCSCRKRPSNRGQNVEARVLEGLVAEQFKHIQLSETFVKCILEKLRALYHKQKEGIDDKKQALWNQQKAIESRLEKAQEKLLSGVLMDDDFSRLRDKINGELRSIQNRLHELNVQHELDFSMIEEVIRLSEDVYRTYMAAPDALRREYLALFWEKFLAQDRQIVKAIPTKMISALIENRAVILSSEWLPVPTAIITLFEDVEYWKYLKKHLDEIRNLQLVMTKAA